MKYEFANQAQIKRWDDTSQTPQQVEWRSDEMCQHVMCPLVL